MEAYSAPSSTKGDRQKFDSAWPRQSLALAEMFTAGGDEDIGGVSSGGGRALKHTRAAGRRQMAPPPTAPSRAYCFRFSLGISVLTAWFCRSMSAMKAGVSA